MSLDLQLLDASLYAGAPMPLQSFVTTFAALHLHAPGTGSLYTTGRPHFDAVHCRSAYLA